jgi:tetratricopeptide (TPR) repeat protein
MGEEYHVAHACLDAGEASLFLGDVEAALTWLEAAMANERRFPMFRTGAPASFCFLVAYHRREERYDAALAILDSLGSGPFASTDFEAQTARALILSERGQHAEARAAAALALQAAAVDVGWVPGHPEVGVVPPIADHPLGERLAAIAAAG